MSDHGHFSFYEGHKERRTGKIRGAFQGCTMLWTAGYWLARQLYQLKASTTMDLGISIFLIFVRCVALRNLDRLVNQNWLTRNLSALLLRTLVVGRRYNPSRSRLLSIWSKEV